MNKVKLNNESGEASVASRRLENFVWFTAAVAVLGLSGSAGVVYSLNKKREAVIDDVKEGISSADLGEIKLEGGTNLVHGVALPGVRECDVDELAVLNDVKEVVLSNRSVIESAVNSYYELNQGKDDQLLNRNIFNERLNFVFGKNTVLCTDDRLSVEGRKGETLARVARLSNLESDESGVLVFGPGFFEVEDCVQEGVYAHELMHDAGVYKHIKNHNESHDDFPTFVGNDVQHECELSFVEQVVQGD